MLAKVITTADGTFSDGTSSDGPAVTPVPPMPQGGNVVVTTQPSPAEVAADPIGNIRAAGLALFGARFVSVLAPDDAHIIFVVQGLQPGDDDLARAALAAVVARGVASVATASACAQDPAEADLEHATGTTSGSRGQQCAPETGS